MYYEMTIAGCKRQLPLCKINDDLYIGAFIMFSDVEITRACAAQLLAKAPEFDVIITAESKGIPLAYEMTRQANINDYIVARKGAKLYMQNVVTTQVDSITCLLYTSLLCTAQSCRIQVRVFRQLRIDALFHQILKISLSSICQRPVSYTHLDVYKRQKPKRRYHRSSSAFPGKRF